MVASSPATGLPGPRWHRLRAAAVRGCRLHSQSPGSSERCPALWRLAQSNASGYRCVHWQCRWPRPRSASEKNPPRGALRPAPFRVAPAAAAAGNQTGKFFDTAGGPLRFLHSKARSRAVNGEVFCRQCARWLCVLRSHSPGPPRR